MKEVDYELIAKRIRDTRIDRCLTQEHLALLVEVNTSHISNVENIRTKPSLPLIINIANALDVSVDYLLMDNHEKSSTVLDQLIYEEVGKCTNERKELLFKVVKVFACS